MGSEMCIRDSLDVVLPHLDVVVTHLDVILAHLGCGTRTPGCGTCTLQHLPDCLTRMLSSRPVLLYFIITLFPASEPLPCSPTEAHLYRFLPKSHHHQEDHPGGWVTGSMLYTALVCSWGTKELFLCCWGSNGQSKTTDQPQTYLRIPLSRRWTLY